MFKSDSIDLVELGRIQQEFEKWEVEIEDHKIVEKFAGDRIFHSMQKLFQEKSDLNRIIRLNTFFEFLRKLKLEPELDRSQNMYFLTHHSNGDNGKPADEEWTKQFELLGSNLGVKLESNVL